MMLFMVVDDVGGFVIGVELLALDLSERYIDAAEAPLVSGSLAGLAATSKVLRDIADGRRADAAETIRMMGETHGSLRLLLMVSEEIEPDGKAGDRVDSMLADSSKRAAAWADCVPRGGLMDRALILFASASALCMAVMRGDLPMARSLAELVEKNSSHVLESIGDKTSVDRVAN